MYLTIHQATDIITEYPHHYHKIIKRDYIEFFNLVQQLTGNNFAEKLYTYFNPNRHTCPVCGNVTKFKEFTTGYHTYCSRRCTGTSDAAKAGQQSFFNNKARVAIKRAKQVQTCTKRYGTSHWMKTEEHKARQSVISRNAMQQKYPITINNRSWRQYSAAVRYMTNKVYALHKDILDPLRKRGGNDKDAWVIDHVYSVYDGFANNVPIDVICHVTNLKLLSKPANSAKHYRSDKTLSDLYEDIANYSLR